VSPGDRVLFVMKEADPHPNPLPVGEVTRFFCGEGNGRACGGSGAEVGEGFGDDVYVHLGAALKRLLLTHFDKDGREAGDMRGQAEAGAAAAKDGALAACAGLRRRA
jgi:hypothetical protein